MRLIAFLKHCIFCIIIHRWCFLDLNLLQVSPVFWTVTCFAASSVLWNISCVLGNLFHVLRNRCLQETLFKSNKETKERYSAIGSSLAHWAKRWFPRSSNSGLIPESGLT